LLLDHLGLDAAAQRVEEAVLADLATRADKGARLTPEVGDAVAARLTC
jgi:3-isopropylmalate dehydrogenase